MFVPGEAAVKIDSKQFGAAAILYNLILESDFQRLLAPFLASDGCLGLLHISILLAFSVFSAIRLFAAHLLMFRRSSSKVDTTSMTLWPATTCVVSSA